MRTINNKTELAEFFRDKLLPYYEKHYREDLTRLDALVLDLEDGLCLCAQYEFKVNIYGIMAKITGDRAFLFPEIMYRGHTAKESLLPRIEWMKQFINDNIV